MNQSLLINVVEALSTVAIAFFAFTTWRATKLYARISGLSLIAEAARLGIGAERSAKLYVDVLRCLRKDFSKEFDALEPHFPAGAKEAAK